MELSISDLEAFVEHRVWKILMQAMLDRTDEKMQAILTTDPVKDPTDISRSQGFVEGLSYILDYPAILKEQIEYERKEEERKDGSGE